MENTPNKGMKIGQTKEWKIRQAKEWKIRQTIRLEKWELVKVKKWIIEKCNVLEHAPPFLLLLYFYRNGLQNVYRRF